MKKSFLLIILLSGCGLLNQEKISEAKLEVQQCKSDYENKVIRTCAEMAKCSDTAFDKISANYPYPDLAEYGKASRTSLCKKVDSGKMSYSDFSLAMAKIGVEITTEEQRRISTATNTNANQTQASAALLGASATMFNAARPVVPTSNTINCSTRQNGAYGSINCQ